MSVVPFHPRPRRSSTIPLAGEVLALPVRRRPMPIRALLEEFILDNCAELIRCAVIDHYEFREIDALCDDLGWAGEA